MPILERFRYFGVTEKFRIANKPKTIMKKYIITSFMAAVAATSVMAGTPAKEVVKVEEPCLFRDQEIQLDLYGLGDFYKGNNGNFEGNLNGLGNGQSSRQISGRPAWGGGLGVNYFFMKYVGLGIEQSVFGRNSNANSQNNPNFDGADYGYTRWQTAGNLILRYPICSWNLAPYIMIGGGAQYGNVPKITYNGTPTGNRTYKMSGQGFGDVGGGLEYRVTQNIGLFSDLRYLFSNVNGLANNQMQWRYGVRFAF